MVRYSLRDDYEFDNVKIGVSVEENLDLKVEFLTEMVREHRGSVVFKIGIGGSIISKPTIHKGRVYFGACDRNIYVLDLETGEEIWRFSTEAQITAAAAIDRDRIYVGSYDGNLYSLDGDGNLIWKFNVGEKIASAPAVHNGNIYFGSKNGTLYAIGRDGNLIWKFNANGPLASPITIHKNRIYFGSFDYNIYCIKLDGKPLWKFAANDIVGGPYVEDGLVCFGSFDKCVYALDNEGNLLWKFHANDAIAIGTNVIAKDDVLYFGSRDNNLYAVRNGELLWKFETGNMIFHRPIIEDSRIYFPSSDGNMYAADVNTGEEIWRFPAGGPLISSEKSGDVICFSCYDCNMYAINTKGELLWKFHTSLNSPSDIDFTPETEHTIFVPIPEYETGRKEDIVERGKGLVVYGDFKGNYIEDEMKDYIGLPVRDGGPKLLYKNKKRVYQK